MSLTAYHIIVQGKVQGVFYRKTTQKKALELGLNGWVKNLDDGSVEIEVEGSGELIEELVNWCAEGPKNAVVSKVEVEEITSKGYSGFRII